MTKRYMHVPNELVAAVGDQIGDVVWSCTAEAKADEQDGGARLSDHQRETVRLLASALPEAWRQRFADLVDDDGDDGTTGVFTPT